MQKLRLPPEKKKKKKAFIKLSCLRIMKLFKGYALKINPWKKIRAVGYPKQSSAIKEVPT